MSFQVSIFEIVVIVVDGFAVLFVYRVTCISFYVIFILSNIHTHVFL